jgi:hypothetical protein
MARRDEQELEPAEATNAFAALMERMLAIQQQQASALEIQTERTKPREDPNYKASSIFLKESGEQWATDLKCQIYLGPIHLNKTPLTREEVEALNTLVPVEKARVTKMDGSTVLATVQPKEDAVGRIDRLTIEIPLKKEDNPQFLPGMVSICAQLVAQAPQAVAA